MAGVVIIQAALFWSVLIYVRAMVAERLEISRWYAFTLPLGAGIFAAMILVSTWKIFSGRGVTWKGRVYPQ